MGRSKNRLIFACLIVFYFLCFFSGNLRAENVKIDFKFFADKLLSYKFDGLKKGEVRALWEVWNDVRENAFYVNNTPEKAMFEKMCQRLNDCPDKKDKKLMLISGIYGILESLNDRYADVFSKEEWDNEKRYSFGNFKGVGIKFVWEKQNKEDKNSPGKMVIKKIYDVGPAKDVGLLSGDIIKSADKLIITTESDSEKFSDYIRNNPGPFEIKIIRKDVPMTFVVPKGDVKEIPVKYWMMGPVAYLKFDSFDLEVMDFFEKAVSSISNNVEIKNLIVDLRGNPGGRVSVLRKFAEEFSKETFATVMFEVNNKGISDYESIITINPRLKNHNIVCIVDENTASAAEILAGFLRLNGATIIGMSTYGKGAVQQCTPVFSAGGDLIIMYLFTTQIYLLADRQFNHDIGVFPDVVVSCRDEDIGTEYDIPLKTAIEILSRGEVCSQY